MTMYIYYYDSFKNCTYKSSVHDENNLRVIHNNNNNNNIMVTVKVDRQNPKQLDRTVNSIARLIPERNAFHVVPI